MVRTSIRVRSCEVGDVGGCRVCVRLVSLPADKVARMEKLVRKYGIVPPNAPSEDEQVRSLSDPFMHHGPPTTRALEMHQQRSAGSSYRTCVEDGSCVCGVCVVGGG